MNHTLPAITLALALASTANAQGVRFGRMHLKQRAGQMEQQGMKQNSTPATVPMARLGSAADKPLDEYDSQGRVKAKTVSYGKNEDFVSYRVMVDYGTDGTTTYTRYELDSGDGSYRLARQWSCYDGGQLASSAEYDYDGWAKYARTFAKTASPPAGATT